MESSRKQCVRFSSLRLYFKMGFTSSARLVEQGRQLELNSAAACQQGNCKIYFESVTLRKENSVTVALQTCQTAISHQDFVIIYILMAFCDFLTARHSK